MEGRGGEGGGVQDRIVVVVGTKNTVKKEYPVHERSFEVVVNDIETRREKKD